MATKKTKRRQLRRIANRDRPTSRQSFWLFLATIVLRMHRSYYFPISGQNFNTAKLGIFHSLSHIFSKIGSKLHKNLIIDVPLDKKVATKFRKSPGFALAEVCALGMLSLLLELFLQNFFWIVWILQMLY